MTLNKEFIEIIDTRVKKFLNSFVIITDKNGRITSSQNSDGKYTVKIDGKDYLVSKKSNDSTEYQVGDNVMIKYSNGDSNRKYIECKSINW